MYTFIYTQLHMFPYTFFKLHSSDVESLLEKFKTLLEEKYISAVRELKP